MSNRLEHNGHGATDLPPWADCEFFCIHDYAGAGTSPCGWRGRLEDTRHEAPGGKIFCPRCGCETLFRIPLHRADESDA